MTGLRVCTTLLAISLALTNAAAVEPAADSASIVVELVGGRTAIGQFDQATDAGALWLRSERGTMSLRRRIARETILRVRCPAGVYTAEEFFAAVAVVGPVIAPAEQAAVRRLYLRTLPPVDPQAEVVTVAAETARISGPLPVTMGLDAWTYRGNGRAGADCLQVRLAGFDAAGRTAQLRGTADIELVGMVRDKTERVSLKRLGRWTRSLPLDSNAGDLLTLPFSGTGFEADGATLPLALLHVRVSVPGRGLLAASQSVRLRHYDAFRDRLEQLTGRRLLAVER